jgi:HEAT repeats
MTRARGTLLAATLLLALASVLVLRRPVDKEKPQLSETRHPQAEQRVSKTRRPPTGDVLPDLPPPAEPPNPPGSPDNAGWTADRLAELEKLAWFDDAGSLEKILAELRSPLPEIRAAALAATRAFGSRDAVPYLEQIANGTSDPEERKAVADAISYLNLPTFLESPPAE